MTAACIRLRRSFVALCAVSALVLTACGGSDDETTAPPPSTSSASTTSSTPTTTSTSSSTETPPPTEEPPPAPPPVNPLTGLEVSGNPVVAAKIDNTNFGGKQHGTAAADVVYVEMVEGGLTRLLAVFHTDLPPEAGPIRSVRTTDPDVLMAFGAPGLAFSGGAGGPLDNLGASSVVNASPAVIGAAYWRTSAASGTYNLRANIAQIAAGVPGISAPNPPGFTFGADYPAILGGRAVGSLTVSMMSPVRFQFTSNGLYHYLRQGAVSVDGNGPTVEIANLLVQRVVAEPDGVVDAAGNPSYKSFSTGSGAFTLYRDGRAVDGTWSRPDVGGPTSYLDAAGAPVLFKPGKTWVLLAPGNARINEG